MLKSRRAFKYGGVGRRKNIYGHAPKSLNFQHDGQLTILETEEINMNNAK